jgi:hypothetical protein
MKVLNATDAEIRNIYLDEAGITLEEISEDILLTSETLKSIGRGTVKVVSNTVKFVGYSALYGIRKLRRKKPY